MAARQLQPTQMMGIAIYSTSITETKNVNKIAQQQMVVIVTAIQQILRRNSILPKKIVAKTVWYG
jgi:hypothetical protein